MKQKRKAILEQPETCVPADSQIGGLLLYASIYSTCISSFLPKVHHGLCLLWAKSAGSRKVKGAMSPAQLLSACKVWNLFVSFGCLSETSCVFKHAVESWSNNKVWSAGLVNHVFRHVHTGSNWVGKTWWNLRELIKVCPWRGGTRCHQFPVNPFNCNSKSDKLDKAWLGDIATWQPLGLPGSIYWHRNSLSDRLRWRGRCTVTEKLLVVMASIWCRI